MKKIIRNISYTVCFAGFVLMLGTAGASDLNTITFEQIVIRGIIAMIMVIVGFGLGNLMNNALIYEKRHNYRK